MKVEVAEIDAEGRLLLPTSVLESFHLKAGDKLQARLMIMQFN